MLEKTIKHVKVKILTRSSDQIMHGKDVNIEYLTINKTNIVEMFKNAGFNEVECIGDSEIYKLDEYQGESKEALLIWPAQIFLTDIKNFINIIEKYLYSTEIIDINFGDCIATLIPRVNLVCKRNNRYSVAPVFDYLNIFYYNNYVKVNTISIESRAFNNIEKLSGSHKKSSTNINKIIDEFKYIENMNASKSIYYPKVSNLIVNDESASYEIESINATDCSILYVNNLLSGEQFKKFSAEISAVISNENMNASTGTFEMRANLSNNFLKRMDELSDLNGWQLFTSAYGKKTQIEVNLIIGKFINYYIKLISDDKLGMYSNIHGDLCLSNILWNPNHNIIKFIDPKGISNYQSYLPVAYDVAKLSHSLLGGYDFVIHQAECLSITESGLHLSINISSKEEIETFVKELSSIINVDYNYIRTVEAALFLSMIPLHSESLRKVMAFGTIALDLIENLDFIND